MYVRKITEDNFYEIINEGARVVLSGGLVVFPTETVYGVGCSASNEKAVARIYRVKRRDRDKPLALLLADIEEVEILARDIPSYAKELMNRYCPGPITLIFTASENVPAFLRNESNTIGLRIPDNKVSLELIRSIGSPLAATSANVSGSTSPSTAREAMVEIGEEVDMIIDGGNTPLKLPSTVVDVTGERPIVLRQGIVKIS